MKSQSAVKECLEMERSRSGYTEKKGYVKGKDKK